MGNNMHAIYFMNKNLCVACGEENCIGLFDIYNKPIQLSKTKSVNYAKCTNCGEEYIPIMDIQSKSITFRDKGNIINNFIDEYKK